MSLDGYIGVLLDPYLMAVYWAGQLVLGWFMFSCYRRLDEMENRAIAIDPILKRLEIKPAKFTKKTKPSLKAKASDKKD